MNASRFGFQAHPLYHFKKHSILQSARQRLSFMIASMSLFAFIIGNMVGQHGWYSFWKTVLGKEDEVMMAFVGTVSPVPQIPNYAEWAKYGGNKQSHTFAQVPQNVLHPLPVYDQTQLIDGSASSFALQVYSTLWKGGYNSQNGSHAGVDIDAPRGTPVQSIANGVVERVGTGNVGFGNFVMIRHPNAPDAMSVGGKTTLHSTYAHLDTVLVREGEVLYKGQQIGTVGNTGLVFGATGYHLYFEIDRDSAPYHPYWPFTSTEASNAGLSYVQAVNSTQFQDRLTEYTLNPMAFVQQYQNFVPEQPIARENSVVRQQVATNIDTPSLSGGGQMRQAAANRLRVRIAALQRTATVAVDLSHENTAVTPAVSQIVKTASVEVQPSLPLVSPSLNTDVDHLTIEHSGTLSRTWQKVMISAMDSQGNLVRSPSFNGHLYVISDFGDAEIRPNELSQLDFVNGVATLHILTRSQTKPVFLVTKGAFETRSAPLVPSR